MDSFEALFRPLTIKGISFRNRIVMPAMNNNFAEPDGSVSERLTNYFAERGKGGTGLIISSPVYIDPAARKRAGALLLHEDRLIPKLRAFTDAIHGTGARVFLQLNHNGRLLGSSKDLKTAVTIQPIGPSAVPRLLTGEVPRALTTEEIKGFVEKYAQCARRAKEAGFDGVELHGAHGYLINQFFSIYSNRRTDEYGGSLENRMRFPLEIYRRVRELTGGQFLVSYRLNAKEFVPMETPLEDTIALCQTLEREGVDMLHVSAGSGETPSTVLKIIPPGSVPRGCYTDFAGAIRANVRIPVIAVGRINTPEVAEQILRDGKADFVATGRALIADPHWPEKASRGELDRIRRCIGCNQGCQERLVQEQKISCLYNPEVGREGEQRPSPEVKKKVWVIGGGPGGMEAAVIAASRGHEVTLYEKERDLGGQALLVSVPPGKEEYSAVKDFLVNELKRLRVRVCLNEEATHEKVSKGRPDAVVLATGSLPIIPEIPGIREENVLTAWEVLNGGEVGKKVLIVGAGMVGCETALFLAKKGKPVVLIEMLDEIGRDVGPMNRPRLKEAVKESAVEVKCKTELVSVHSRGATVRNENGPYDIPAETVVLAVGARPQNSLFPALEGKVRELYAIGDCVSARKMIEAIHEAYDVGMKL
jgi:2,4-dienoyl-CoA reductase-like NADH-dependent reductase (Old Yellow Enzyme family)/thioredoxin reductase